MYFNLHVFSQRIAGLSNRCAPFFAGCTRFKHNLRPNFHSSSYGHQSQRSYRFYFYNAAD